MFDFLLISIENKCKKMLKHFPNWEKWHPSASQMPSKQLRQLRKKKKLGDQTNPDRKTCAKLFQTKISVALGWPGGKCFTASTLFSLLLEAFFLLQNLGHPNVALIKCARHTEGKNELLYSILKTATCCINFPTLLLMAMWECMCVYSYVCEVHFGWFMNASLRPEEEDDKNEEKKNLDENGKVQF